MARKRRKGTRTERAKPLVLRSKIASIPIWPVENKSSKHQLDVRTNILRQIIKNTAPRVIKKVKAKPVILQNITNEITHSPSCQAKKAKARHNYFSMRKSGKGASRTNPQTDRFNSRC